MARNRSEKVAIPIGMSQALLDYLTTEATSIESNWMEESLSSEYKVMGFRARCRFRAALRKAAGLPAHEKGLASGDPVL